MGSSSLCFPMAFPILPYTQGLMCIMNFCACFIYFSCEIALLHFLSTAPAVKKFDHLIFTAHSYSAQISSFFLCNYIKILKCFKILFNQSMFSHKRYHKMKCTRFPEFFLQRFSSTLPTIGAAWRG